METRVPVSALCCLSLKIFVPKLLHEDENVGQWSEPARTGRSLCSAGFYLLDEREREPIRRKIYVLAKNARALYTKRGRLSGRV